jgi:hypothetical protein
MPYTVVNIGVFNNWGVIETFMFVAVISEIEYSLKAVAIGTS